MMVFALRLPLGRPSQPRLWTTVAPYLLLTIVWSIAVGRLANRNARKLQREPDELG